MRRNSIQIQTLNWEIITQSLHVAKEWQDKASRLSANRIPEMIDKMFQKYNDANLNIRLDKLVLETDFSENFSEEQILEIIEQSLERSIAENSAFEKANSDRKPEPGEWTIALQFIHFLQTGILPWHADELIFNNPELLLSELLKNAPLAMQSALSGISGSGDGIARMLAYFNERQLEYFINHCYGFSENRKAFLTLMNILVQQKILAISSSRQLKFDFLLKNPDKISLAADDLTKWVTYSLVKDQISTGECKALLEFIPGPGIPGAASNELAIIQQFLRDNRIPEMRESSLPDAAENLLQEKKINPAEDQEVYFISNAGIILFYPCLKELFTRKKLFSGDRFLTEEKKSIAATMLQQFASGSNDFKEYHLVLNKILCGIDLSAPVLLNDKKYRIPGKAECEKFFQSCFRNWKHVRSTSVNGIRSSLVFRKGRLKEEPDHYSLHIERKGMDIIFDSLPYPISIINLPWMIKPLFVQW